MKVALPQRSELQVPVCQDVHFPCGVEYFRHKMAQHLGRRTPLRVSAKVNIILRFASELFFVK